MSSLADSYADLQFQVKDLLRGEDLNLARCHPQGFLARFASPPSMTMVFEEKMALRVLQ